MKQLASIFRILFLLLAAFFPVGENMASNMRNVEYYDSVEVGLITCSPHEEIYSLYGHTALRLHDLHTGEDIAFNYGVFNYKQDFFVLRFMFGKTDYELGIAPFKAFCKYYQQWGSEVSEQLLNLTAEEKRRIVRALAENFLPENRVYRYNFFFDNCATRPRDMIERCIDGVIDYPRHHGKAPSFREMIHEHTMQHPWAAVGIDLLLGVRADMETTQREQHFLPENLQRDCDKAVIRGQDGMIRPLVSKKRQIVAPGVQLVEQEFPLSPTACAIVLLLVSLVIASMEWKRKRVLIVWDAVLMGLTGLAGCIIFVMFFSEHPATSTNTQLLLLNPIHLICLPAVLRGKQSMRYWYVLLLLLVLFFIAGFWQQYAEGMYFLALCLLIRVCIHFRNDK